MTHSRFSAQFFLEKRAEKNGNEQSGKYKSVKKNELIAHEERFLKKRYYKHDCQQIKKTYAPEALKQSTALISPIFFILCSDLRALL